MSAALIDPHQGLAVEQPSSIVPEDSGLTGSDADRGSHSQDSSFSSEGPHTPKDGDFTYRADKVVVAGANDAVTATNQPELLKGGLVGSEEDNEEEEEDDDDDDGFIPRGLPTRPTGAGANAGPRPVKAGR